MERPSPLSLPMRRFAYPTHAVFLSQSALLEEFGPPRIPALACLLGFALVCIAIVTSALVKIDVISTSEGQLISSIPHQNLQSFYGGIVDQLHVREGQVVDKHDLLLTLQDPEAEAQLKRLEARQVSLSAQAQRLNLLVGIAPLNATIVRPETALLNIQQMAILPLDEAAAISERSLVQAELSRQTKTLTNLHAVRENTSRRLRLANQKISKQKLLLEKNLLPAATFLQAQQEAAETRLDLTKVDGQIIDMEAAILESKQRLHDVIAARQQQQGHQLSSIMVELGELDQQISMAKSRLGRATLRAPLHGVVHELNAKFVGQVIAPGETLLDLIPVDNDLVVDARLPTREIRHVVVGQEVRVAVDGIEPHRAGYLEGEVQRLSPSTFIDENGVPYYRALISLKSNELAKMPLIPGMTVQAQIKTDQRTILEYLLKPVYRAWASAFRER